MKFAEPLEKGGEAYLVNNHQLHVFVIFIQPNPKYTLYISSYNFASTTYLPYLLVMTYANLSHTIHKFISTYMIPSWQILNYLVNANIIAILLIYISSTYSLHITRVSCIFQLLKFTQINYKVKLILVKSLYQSPNSIN